MPTVVAEASVRVLADLSALRSGLDEMRRETEDRFNQLNRTNSFVAMFTGIGAVITLFHELGGAIQGAVGFVKSFVDAAADAERTSALLAVGIDRLGGKIGYTAGQFDSIIRGAQGLGTSSLFQVQEAARQLMTSGQLRGTNFKEALALAQDYAAWMGTTLPQAAEHLSHQLGNVQHSVHLLARQGLADPAFIQSIELMQKQGHVAEAQAAVIDRLKQAYAGAAAAVRETFGGQVARIGNALEEARAAIGSGFLPVLKEAAAGIESFLQSDTWKGWVQLVRGIAADVASDIKALAGAVSSSLPTWDQFKRTITNILENVAAAAHDPRAAFDLLSAALASWITDIKDQLSDIWTGWINALHQKYPAVDSMWKLIGLGLKDALFDAIDAAVARMDEGFWKTVARYSLIAEYVPPEQRPGYQPPQTQTEKDKAERERLARQAANQAAGDDGLFGISATKLAAQEQKDALNAQMEQWKKLRQERAAAAQRGVPGKPGDVGAGTPDTNYGQVAPKAEFTGFADMAKGIQQALSQGSMTELTQQIAQNTAMANEKAGQQLELLKKMANRLPIAIAG
jgi:hypothetical protein